ncbi:MAG: hypothetical protein Q7S75_02955 [bacterium]|nr:hypothetical protein [bacterium]
MNESLDAGLGRKAKNLPDMPVQEKTLYEITLADLEERHGLSPEQTRLISFAVGNQTAEAKKAAGEYGQLIKHLTESQAKTNDPELKTVLARVIDFRNTLAN